MKASTQKRIKVKLNKAFLNRYMRVYQLLKGIDSKKVVFSSFNGKTYSDNPRAISEKLHEMDSSLDIVWMFNDPEERKEFVPPYVRSVKLTRFSQLKEHATAGVWVDNFTKPLHFHKNKKQLYIQTWHGDRGFKKVLHDSTFVSHDYELLESSICDIMISASDFCDNVYRSAFRFKGEILKVGSPRNDRLVNGESVIYKKIRELYGISEDAKILLYAPTLRRASTSNGVLQDASQINLGRGLDILNACSNENWVCFVRAHVSVSGLSGVPDDKRFIDVSKYEDMADILLATDLLITDYSSSAGDFILQKRPVILYQNDRKEYVEKDRTFYFELDDCPYHMVENQEEFEKIIPRVLTEDIGKNSEDVLAFYNTIETGQSSEIIAKRIVEHCNN